MYHKVARDISTNNNNNKMTNLDGLHSNYDIKNNNNYNTNRYNESSRPVVLTTEHKTHTYIHSSLEACEQILNYTSAVDKMIIEKKRNSIRFENSSGFYAMMVVLCVERERCVKRYANTS
jgi:hypothetical protein